MAADLFPFYDPRQVSILLIQQGTNDLGPGSSYAGSFLYALLTNFVSLSKATGFYVVVDTFLPRQDANWTSAMEQQRLAYNVLVRANSAQADAVNDIASDPVIGDGTNPGTSFTISTGCIRHPPGQQRLATLDSAVLGLPLRCPIRSATQ